MDENNHRFDKVIVPKPWGYEYQIFQNEYVAIWRLHIKAGHSTSLHCHANKKTGLLMFEGRGRINFLNDSHPIQSLSKVMIRHGVFHQTVAETDVQLLEIETPPDKSDLIRLEDSYGRTGTPYELPETYIPSASHELFKGYQKIKDTKGDISLIYRTIENKDDAHVSDQLMMILEGGIKFNNYHVLGPGDIVVKQTWEKLIKKFDLERTVYVGITEWVRGENLNG